MGGDDVKVIGDFRERCPGGWCGENTDQRAVGDAEGKVELKEGEKF